MDPTAAGEVVWIVREGEADPDVTDQYGDPAPGPVQRIRLEGVMVAPRSSSEDNVHRSAVIVGLTVYVPAGQPTVFASDELEVRGKVRQVEGEPGEWVDPWSGAHVGTEVALRGVEG